MQQNMVLKIDLHCHSEASHDCISPIEAIAERCIARGINVQAITDHNQVWGAQKLQEYVIHHPEYSKKLLIIVGEEVMSSEGEIIGLFLKERIKPHLSPEETIAEIKRQGGLVLLPHGFDPLKRWRLSPQARERVAKDIDIIESFNARVSREKWNDTASLWAVKHDKAQSAGTDAHLVSDVGMAWTESPFRGIQGPEDLLTALRESHIQGIWTHPVKAFINKMIYRLKIKLGKFFQHSQD